MKAAEDRYNYLNDYLDALDTMNTTAMTATERLKYFVQSEKMRDEFFELRDQLAKYYQTYE